MSAVKVIEGVRYERWGDDETSYVSGLIPMQSAAGWYVGRAYWDNVDKYVGPWSRDSHYMASKEEAEAWIASMEE